MTIMIIIQVHLLKSQNILGWITAGMIHRIHYDHEFAECVCLHCKRARAELTAVLVNEGQGLRERRVA